MVGKISVGDAIKFGWNATKANLGFWIGIVIVSGLVTGIPAGIVQAMNDQGSNLAPIVNLIGYALQVWIGIGLMRIALAFVDGKKPEFAMLFSGRFELWWKSAVAGILVGLMVMLGLFLLIIPGVILALKYYYSGYFVVDKNADPIAAIKMSGSATKGHLGEIFLFALACIGLTILGMIPLGLGLFLTIPICIVASAWIYRKLSAGVHATATVAAPQV